jgi:hypothetical protein
MRKYCSILLILPVMLPTAIVNAQSPPAEDRPAATIQPAGAEPWCNFGRAGKTMSVRVRPFKGFDSNTVVLRAFGRVWTKPLAIRTVKRKVSANVALPAVRVPTLFGVTPPDDPRQVGQIIVYPDTNVRWDTKRVVHAAGTPVWFDQWVLAIGLQVVYPTDAGFKDGWGRSKDKRHVLVLGGRCAGKEFVDALAVAKKHEMNILVLDANWFGGKSGKVAIRPRQMACELAVIRKQKWPEPMLFRSGRLPWSPIANRWAWIGSKDDLPLVEEIANQASSQKVVVSYVPWAEQLGRCEAADRTLLDILSAATEPARKLAPRMGDVLYPSQKVLEETKEQRPVLTAASKAWARAFIEDIPSRIPVIDLRGGTSPLLEFRKTLERLENRNDDGAGPLILGDDPLLDNWKWVKIDRKKRVSKRVGVLWLPDDTLPPSKNTQIRLMLILTELGIPLKTLKTGE